MAKVDLDKDPDGKPKAEPTEKKPNSAPTEPGASDPNRDGDDIAKNVKDPTEWSSLRDQANNRTLRVDPAAVKACAEACRDLVATIIGYRDFITNNGMNNLRPFSHLEPGGRALAVRFNQKGNDVVQGMNLMSKVLENMGDTFIAAMRAYLAADGKSAADIDAIGGMGGIKPKPPQNAPIDIRPDKPGGDIAKLTPPSNADGAVPIAVRAAASFDIAGFVDFGRSLIGSDWRANEAGARYTWMAGSLGADLDAFNEKLRRVKEDAWSGTGKDAAIKAVQRFRDESMKFTESMNQLGKDLVYCSQWLWRTFNSMPEYDYHGCKYNDRLREYREAYNKHYVEGINGAVAAMPAIAMIGPPPPPANNNNNNNNNNNGTNNNGTNNGPINTTDPNSPYNPNNPNSLYNPNNPASPFNPNSPNNPNNPYSPFNPNNPNSPFNNKNPNSPYGSKGTGNEQSSNYSGKSEGNGKGGSGNGSGAGGSGSKGSGGGQSGSGGGKSGSGSGGGKSGGGESGSGAGKSGGGSSGAGSGAGTPPPSSRLSPPPGAGDGSGKGSKPPSAPPASPITDPKTPPPQTDPGSTQPPTLPQNPMQSVLPQLANALSQGIQGVTTAAMQGGAALAGLAASGKLPGMDIPGGGGGAGGGAGGPNGHAGPANPAEPSKLFPRAAIPYGPNMPPGLGQAGPMGGIPPAAPPGAANGANGRGEHKRAKFLDSVKHLEEAFGPQVEKVKPVIEP
ncbi:hypothetical protein NDR87_19705 [Nocardia sp. CDC159]|uniref:Uncharacterized protein n=1 Tax=Nocardia pulmonis TaxID=2951408 RepID=A0A9X2IZI9_9NOCA|nr:MULTISPECIES: hypothetical protein [Nocardia]MCM6776080.1 hypothetical protein [Nocardia pulmonis]MCM6788593.1 hypothetical protein [Nocardia sp. CDC159]